MLYQPHFTRSKATSLPLKNPTTLFSSTLLRQSVNRSRDMRLQRKSKKPDSASKLVLEEIIGLTARNANGLSANIWTGDCVYIAGCVVVIYNVESGTQSHLMVSSRMPKPLSCVAVSNQDGSFIAAGETGHQPAVLVWDYSSRAFRFELKVHCYGVACIAFSPDGKHLVSVGFPHDGYFCLWDLRSGLLVTKLKSSSSCSVISSVSFSSNAHFFITAGKKHLKIWTVGSSTRSHSNAAGLLAMEGKSANVGLLKGSSFISVISARLKSHTVVGIVHTAEFSPMYALTDTGTLCLLSSGFSIKLSVDLKVEKGFTLSASDKLVACACNNGVVKLFTVETLKLAGSVQYSDAKDYHTGTSTFSDTKSAEKQFDPVLPDAIACQFSTSEKLVVVYGNHSLYVWDVRDATKVSRCSVLVSHSACIWDVKNLSCENMHDPALACVVRGCCGGVSFATCSADGTIRLWDLALQKVLDQKDNKPEGASSQDLGSYSLDTDQGGSIRLVSAGIFERDIVESEVSTEGFRSMAVSSDGTYLAAGDSHGNLHIYNLDTAEYTCLQDSHDAEILSLAFSLPSKTNCHNAKEVSDDKYLLASGGRDRMIHLYDVKRGFKLIESVDEHSAAVTSVKFTCNGCKLLSCSADRSLVFRDVAITDSGCKISRCHYQIASNGTVYDMAVDPAAEVAVTVGQDKKINTFNISSGKLIKTFKQDGEYGEPIKVSMDPSSSYLVCSYSNKSVCIYDFSNGDLMTQGVGHSEVITGVIFLPDCKHIISVGGDSCIFVWKVPSPLSSRMLQSVKEHAGPLSPTIMHKVGLSNQCLSHKGLRHPCNNSSKDILLPENFDLSGKRSLPQQAPGFRFSISRLPNWAQAKVTSTKALTGLPETLSELQLSESPSASKDNSYENFDANGPTEIHSPSQQDLQARELCPTDIPKNSFGSNSNTESPMPQGFKSFGMDKRWLTIHTVYADLLDSPMKNSENEKMLVSASNLFNNPNLEGPSKDECLELITGEPTTTYQVSMKSSCGSNGCIQQLVDDGLPQPRTQQVGYNTGNSYADENITGDCYTELCSEISPEQLSSETIEIQLQTTSEDEDTSRLDRDDDLFSQHFSTLSSPMKIEGSRASTRRSYSARFVVSRDHLRGCRRLFETTNPIRSTELLDTRDEVAPHIPSGQAQLLEELQQLNAHNQGVPDALLNPSLQQNDLTTSSLIDHPITTEEAKENNQKCASEETETQKRLNDCKEALLQLDLAAENTINLFSKLGSRVGGEETSCGDQLEFYQWAAEVIPTITKKLHSLNLAKSSVTSSVTSSIKVENSSFEPLVEKFAESLSRQVLEIVMKNLSSAR